jgi:hypothetical protein
MKELEKYELANINGGYMKMPPWVKGGLWFGLICLAVENWSEIKSGIADGWNDSMKEK